MSTSPAGTSTTEAVAASSSAQQRLLIALLGAAAFIVNADVRVVNPLLPVIATEFKTNIGSVGFIVTAYAIPYGLFQIFYGPLGDRIGKLRVIVVAMALFAFGTAACALVSSLLMLDILRFVTGATAAALIPLSIAYIGDHVPYAERQPAIAQLMGAVALGSILSTSLGGIVADYLNWRFIFLIYGIISISVFALLWRTTRGINEAVGAGKGKLFSLSSLKPYYLLLKEPAPRLVILTVFLEGFFFFGGQTYLGAFLRDQYQLLYIIIGLILSCFGLGGLVYTRLAKWLLRRLGENGLIISGGLFIMLSFLGITLIYSWIVFIALTLLMGLGFYMFHNTLQTRATEMAPKARGTAVSLFAFSLFIGQGAGAAVQGYIVDGPGYTPVFLIAGITTCLLALSFAFLSRRQKPHQGDHEEQSQNSVEFIGID